VICDLFLVHVMCFMMRVMICNPFYDGYDPFMMHVMCFMIHMMRFICFMMHMMCFICDVYQMIEVEDIGNGVLWMELKSGPSKGSFKNLFNDEFVRELNEALDKVERCDMIYIIKTQIIINHITTSKKCQKHHKYARKISTEIHTKITSELTCDIFASLTVRDIFMILFFLILDAFFTTFFNQNFTHTLGSLVLPPQR